MSRSTLQAYVVPPHLVGQTFQLLCDTKTAQSHPPDPGDDRVMQGPHATKQLLLYLCDADTTANACEYVCLTYGEDPVIMAKHLSINRGSPLGYGAMVARMVQAGQLQRFWVHRGYGPAGRTWEDFMRVKRKRSALQLLGPGDEEVGAHFQGQVMTEIVSWLRA